MKTLLLLLGFLCAVAVLQAQSSFKGGDDAKWIQVGEGEFQKFGAWGSIAQVEFESDEKAIAKAITFNGAPRFNTALTFTSRTAVNRLRERLRKEGPWFPVKIGGREAMVRWRVVDRVNLVRENDAPGRKALRLQHINSGHALELGSIEDPKLVDRILKELEENS